MLKSHKLVTTRVVGLMLASALAACGSVLDTDKVNYKTQTDEPAQTGLEVPPDLSKMDVVLAFRESRGYPAKRWKSNVKLANAQGDPVMSTVPVPIVTGQTVTFKLKQPTGTGRVGPYTSMTL